jgi:hypothetical protein
MRVVADKIRGVPAGEWQTLVFRGSLSLSVASFLVLVSLLVWHFSDKSEAVNSAQDLALEGAKAASRQIDNNLSRLLIAQAIADDLTSGRLTDSEVEARLINELAANPQVTAFTICYKPEFVPPSAPHADQKRYCLVFPRSN